MDLTILGAAAINGLLIGGIYTLVASGLTLIYGVLHIINFAHGSMLMLAMFGVYYLLMKLGIDPYMSLLIMVPAMYLLGYLLYKLLIGRLAQGKDEVNALYELFEQKLHEQDQSLRALLRTLPPTHELSYEDTYNRTYLYI